MKGKKFELLAERLYARMAELDKLYIDLWKASGFRPEQLLEMFMAGYTLKSPVQDDLLVDTYRKAIDVLNKPIVDIESLNAGSEEPQK